MGEQAPLRVVHVAAEGLPFYKTGGLGDVVGALPSALVGRGLDVTVVLPAHRDALPGAPPLRRTDRVVGGDGDGAVGEQRFRVAEGLTSSGVRLLLLENAALFDRDGIYSDAEGRGYDDNWLRYAAFARAAGELASQDGFDVVHCHDWHAALLPVYDASRARTNGRERGAPRLRTLLTIHNLAYQGVFPRAVWPELGLPDEWLAVDGLEFHGSINFLKGGILYADALSTVSPTYAREILTSEHGAGLDGVLRNRADALTGILNGIDPAEWHPAGDPLICCAYDSRDLSGKARCKAALQAELGLSVDDRAPLAGVVSRLAEQKGIDLLLAALPQLVEEGLQVAVLGSGDPRYEDAFLALARRFPGRVAVRLEFEPGLAHRIEAGADLFLMPSRYEPCGLNQMYSLRYGTLPVVRSTGGLADTVVDAADVERGTGYVFGPSTAAAFRDAVRRALAEYRRSRGNSARGDPTWSEMQRRGMRQDFSWSLSAARYVELYRSLAGDEEGPEHAGESATGAAGPTARTAAGGPGS